MTVKRVQAAAWRRGVYFDGVKKWRNTCVGCAYEIFSPTGRGFFQADTLQGLYNYIIKFEPVKEGKQ